MILSGRHIKILTTVLLVVQLCLPVYGPDHFSGVLASLESGNSGFVCTHADVESDHDSQEGHKHFPHCHELNAPCEITSGLVLDHSPIISKLSLPDKGTLLPGYGNPIDIPPENRV